MTLTLDLPEELEARLRAEAKANGTNEAEAVRRLLEIALRLTEGATSVTHHTAGDYGVLHTTAGTGASSQSGRGEFAHKLADWNTFPKENQKEIQDEIQREEVSTMRTPREILAEWDKDDSPSVFARSGEDSVTIARRLREEAQHRDWKAR